MTVWHFPKCKNIRSFLGQVIKVLFFRSGLPRDYFLESSAKVKCSFVNAFYFFDVRFLPTTSLEHKYSESVRLSVCKVILEAPLPATPKSHVIRGEHQVARQSPTEHPKGARGVGKRPPTSAGITIFRKSWVFESAARKPKILCNAVIAPAMNIRAPLEHTSGPRWRAGSAAPDPACLAGLRRPQTIAPSEFRWISRNFPAREIGGFRRCDVTTPKQA